MMFHKYNVADAEFEVLQMLWRCGGEVRQTELLKQFEMAGKAWKRQTLNTLLARLEEKKLVERENRVVRAVLSQVEYNNLQMQENIEHMYGGKLSSFIAAFTGQKGISEEEAEEIRKLLEKKKGEQGGEDG